MVDRIQFETEDTGAMPPAGAQSEPDPNRPEWLDPKFTKPEDLAKAYAELQARATQQQQELAALKKTPAANPEDTSATSETGGAEGADGGENKPDDKPDDKEAAEKAAIEAAQKAGVDFTPWVDEFNETGDVKPESRTAIAEALKKVPAFANLPVDEIVNDYIEGRKVSVSNDVGLMVEEAGGQEQLDAMRQWAADPKNFPRAEAEAFNKAINSNDRHAALFAIRGLRAKYEASNSVDPARRLNGEGNPSPTSSGFRSTAEMVRAMQDPRYQTDEAYRNEVRDRIKLSRLQ